MAMVLFILRFMERVWTLYVLGGWRGEVRVGWEGGGEGGLGGSGGSGGLDGGCVMLGWVRVLSLYR